MNISNIITISKSIIAPLYILKLNLTQIFLQNPIPDGCTYISPAQYAGHQYQSKSKTAFWRRQKVTHTNSLIRSPPLPVSSSGLKDLHLIQSLAQTHIKYSNRIYTEYIAALREPFTSLLLAAKMKTITAKEMHIRSTTLELKAKTFAAGAW